MSAFMDYGIEPAPAKRTGEIRHLLRCMSVAIIYAATLWVLGTIALHFTVGDVTSDVIPSVEQTVFVEHANQAR